MRPHVSLLDRGNVDAGVEVTQLFGTRERLKWPGNRAKVNDNWKPGWNKVGKDFI